MNKKEIKIKKLRYSSIIPKLPHTLTAYQLFNKTKYNEIKENITSSEKISRLSELWKNLPAEEVEIYKARAEAEKYEIKKEWDKTFESREEERRKWCVKFNQPLNTSWEELDGLNRSEWVKLHPSGENKKEKKSKKSKSKSQSDDDTSSSSDDNDYPQKRKADKLSNDGTKKKRAAVEHALLRMKESSASFEDTNFSNLSDDDSTKKKNSKTHNASPKPGNSSGLLSGSYFSTNSNISRNNNNNSSNIKEGKMLKKRTSRLGDVEWVAAIWGEERVKAVLKGIDRVYEMALNQDNFDIFGNDMIQCFYDVATVTGEPIRSKTLKYVEHLANRWKYTVMQDGWKQDNAQPTPCEVIEVVTGMYCMERVGIRHDLKAEVLKFLNSKKAYNAKDYFGWDPINETLSDEGGMEVISDCQVSKYRLMSSSLIHSFYSDRVGLTLGCQYADIFRWLPVLRPYKGPHQLPWQDYIDQCYLITHIIFTTNNWGELSLDPSLFPHEYFFIRNHLDIHIQQRDVHLIAEFVESLRCFGCTDEDPLIRKGMKTLLGLQTESGIWDPTEDEPYRTYHATMCAIQALLAHRFRGFGPGIPSVLPLLVQWSKELIEKSEEYRTNTREMNTQLTTIAETVTNLRELEYGPLISGDIATEGSITKPKDINAHSTERMNTLKMSMRSFAKATGHLFTVIPETPQINKSTDDIKLSKTDSINDIEINEENGLILDELYQKIGNYLQFLGMIEKSNDATPISFNNDDSDTLLSLLQKSINIHVTPSILQSNRYKNLTKNIRILSKGKGKEDLIDKNIQSSCAKLMAEWKNYILTSSNKNISESNNNNSQTISQNNDSTPLSSPSSSLPLQKQQIEDISMEIVNKD